MQSMHMAHAFVLETPCQEQTGRDPRGQTGEDCDKD